MSDTTIQRCSATTPSQGGWHWGRCHKPAKVEREGRHYCSVHDPERQKQKRQEKYRQWDAERALNDALGKLFTPKAYVAKRKGVFGGFLVSFTCTDEQAVRALAERFKGTK